MLLNEYISDCDSIYSSHCLNDRLSTTTIHNSQCNFSHRLNWFCWTKIQKKKKNLNKIFLNGTRKALYNDNITEQKNKKKIYPNEIYCENVCQIIWSTWALWWNRFRYLQTTPIFIHTHSHHNSNSLFVCIYIYISNSQTMNKVHMWMHPIQCLSTVRPFQFNPWQLEESIGCQ